MKPRLRKTANLSESVHQQLNMYAIAAGAAGVSALALAQPVEAKIVYTSANVRIQNEQYSIDLNHDGLSDVVIHQRCFGYGCFLSAYGKGIESYNLWAAALHAGAKIGKFKRFHTGTYGAIMALCRKSIGHHTCTTSQGYWHYAEARYLGVKFRINGKTHFGWARFKNSSPTGATLTGYAYETVPGNSIIAGKTHGPADEWDKDDRDLGASLSRPIPDIPQPASLGPLALGAQGVPLWRRKETQEVVGQ